MAGKMTFHRDGFGNYIIRVGGAKVGSITGYTHEWVWSLEGQGSGNTHNLSTAKAAAMSTYRVQAR